MTAVLKVLDAEISKYEALVRHLKASRDAIMAAEGGASRAKGLTNGAAAGGKKRGRPKKAADKAPAAAGAKRRGRPPKAKPAESAAPAAE